ncbi:MAG: hypothetical protein A3H71_01495 [Candidatus Sungbacteria bacterium RIFCSPLOWO2_02_FULL_48_13b]|uniref:Uncharacterized protein n=1 Tax=Candidatus Sungbacteria bacterium RIFCSPLOWO2_02_FULL_48_13b TaxID=1802283 RepID=A0A1G2LEL0_9BACT|nr:MAG: hypothetical protein A3H71_01495 [Candidatus Sungbacteria bacterium RIFCSPLOWO2_02_FULL_48_13b]
MRTRFCQNYFLGKRISQNLGWLLFLYFVRAEKGLGRNAGGFALLKSCLRKRIMLQYKYLKFQFYG